MFYYIERRKSMYHGGTSGICVIVVNIWTRQAGFKSWTRLFHFELMLLGKA